MDEHPHRFPVFSIPPPYGAHVMPDGVQFTLFSREAERVWLLLFDDPYASAPAREIELAPDRNRLGDIWHAHVPEAREGQCYAYRVEGAHGPGDRPFDPDQWLLDPYARAVAGAPAWGDTMGLPPGARVRNGAAFPKGVIVRDDFDWDGDLGLRYPMSRSVIYEAHARGMTAHRSSRVQAPGAYRGLTEKIPYLVDLGITAVELLPVQEFNEMEFYLENMTRRELRNFWGYSTLAFFAPNGRYAASGVRGGQVREFKEMVKAFHQAGIEVILDVVFNHTAEGGAHGPTYSFRGLDEDVYYMLDDKRHYRNYSGCGNTVNSNHPIVRDFIIDCLRYWVLNMHVDGFRFDLASVLTRDPEGNLLPDPPIVEHIAEDPVLRDTKIIAEAWDAAGAYQVGSFPNERWSEWNGRYRDDMRRFWRGDANQLRAFVNRLIGSPDLYNKDGQTPQKSIDFITCHDGFTLYDLVSYETKRNQANGENNKDGENHNFSKNYGVEGPTDRADIEAVRRRQMKNFLATLILSQGVPMIAAGDELGRTQRGNNNAYCQDNELSWVDWDRMNAFSDVHALLKALLAFRKAHPAFGRTYFLGDQPNGPGVCHILWFSTEDRDIDWDRDTFLSAWLKGIDRTGQAVIDDDFFLIFNASEQHRTFRAPDVGRPWEPVLTTQERPAEWHPDARRLVAEPRSVHVLRAPRA